jgi:serine protease
MQGPNAVKRTTTALVRVVVAVAALAAAGTAPAQERNPARTHPHGVEASARILVEFKSPSATQRVSALAVTDRTAALAARTGLKLESQRRLGATLDVLTLESPAAAEAALDAVRADPAVAAAELDRRRYPHALPNDPLYPQQWYQHASDATTPSAIDAEHAWDLTTGSTGVIIAVLDTGVRFDHPDLLPAEGNGRLLPGYDFVADTATANDGNGRDSDPTDPGDFVSQADTGTNQFRDCEVADSSWHGTRTAALIGARTDNGQGMAGGTWTPWILPVRVLGKCGGFDSDILAAMLWAAGIHVDGVPDNDYPARIVNMSLGATGPCTLPYRDVIAELGAVGTLVVVSAGNEGGPVDEPANCAGAVAVAGLRHAGTKVGYSSLGTEIAVGAPAGNCVNLTGACVYSIATAVNLGATAPGANGYTDQLNFNVGTSFSAPIVAGIAGLMASVNGNLKPSQLRDRLMEGATLPFPVSADVTVPMCHVPAAPGDVQGSECNCTTDTCGAGMANALGAVLAALRPIAAVAVPASVSAGQDVVLDGAGSAAACGGALSTFAWSIAGGTGTITGNPDAATTVVVAPASGSFTVRLTVTDDAGRTDTADVVVTPTTATTLAPTVAGAAACPTAIPTPAPSVTVSISPSSVSVRSGDTKSFTATVVNSTNTAVGWYVDGVLGGNATSGTISTSGLYTAPAGVTVAKSLTVSAAWSGDPTRTGAAQVTVTPASFGNSGGGGGGGLAWLELTALLTASLLHRRRRA